MNADELRAKADCILLAVTAAQPDEPVLRAAGDLAAAWLAANPADDGEAVTDDRLLAAGFDVTTSGCACLAVCDGLMTGLALIRSTPGAARWIYQEPALWAADDEGGAAYVRAPQTMGELRALCRVLGIPLTEGGPR